MLVCRRMQRLLPAFCALVSCGLAQAQPRTFEVASVKPSKAGPVGGNTGRGGSLRASPGSVVAENVSLWKLIGTAYGVGADRDYAIVGPDWLKSQRYDIAARMPADTSMPQALEMMQSLLAERFKVA